jgi:acyl-homoserine lactone acylase PvdQ
MRFAAENALAEVEKDPESKLVFDAYTRGVNAYIDGLTQAELPLEYKLLGVQPERWSNIRSALLLKMMARNLSSGTEIDLSLTNAKSVFLPDELKKLYLIENNVEVKNVKIEISQFLTDKINGSELIMIDGILRNYLLELCANSKFKGVIVLDNADRKEYTKGISELESKGWIQTSFSGIGPINPYGWTTSVFHINK